nr:VirK/YbjX family protein [uncultured Duganella sp.]
MPQSITICSGAAGFTGFKYVRERLKLALRARWHHHATSGWLQLLNSHPMFAELVTAQPRLIYKIFRPYLSNTTGPGGRLAMLSAHYRHVFRHGLGPLTVRAARGPVPLARVEGKSGLPYHVQLRAIDPMEREGELVLQLMQGDELVTSCAFAFIESDGRMQLGVGCMQGPKGERGLQLIKDATRELHGLRPKNLLVKLLSQIAHDHDCATLRLVGNANRAVCGATRQGKVHADYDTLWLELGASQRADGDFQLASEPICEPDLAQIASKKRSEARKRHETLCELAQALGVSLHAPRIQVVPVQVEQPALWPMEEDAEKYALA